MQFEKREIHKVFLRFPNFHLEQNLSLTTLVNLIIGYQERKRNIYVEIYPCLLYTSRAQTQTAVYQHDMRHHLTMLEGLITAGKPEQASQYIRKVQSDIETITPRRYCENELVNLLCSSFAEKAQHAGARLDVDCLLYTSRCV